MVYKAELKQQYDCFHAYQVRTLILQTIGGHLGSRCDYMDMVPILFVLEATVNLMDIRGKI